MKIIYGVHKMNAFPETALAYLRSTSVGAKRTSTGRSAPSRSGTNPYAGLASAVGKYQRCGCFFQRIHFMHLYTYLR